MSNVAQSYTPAIQFAIDNRTQYVDLLIDLLKIPSISTQSQHTIDVKKAADWLVAYMQKIGLNGVEIMPTGGHPVVYGEWLEAGLDAPTVLVYGHYDVQPADPLEKWDTAPFEPTIRGDDLVARGATDDKGQSFIHLAAVDSILQSEGSLPVNIKFLLEGEEEIGSKNLEAFIASHTDLLAADCAVISDSGFAAPGLPNMVYGLRGLAVFEIEVRSAKQDLHSGMYGGVVHNPLMALAQILAKMHTETGTITIPGYYDDIVPMDEDERALLAAIPESYLAETGVPKLWGEPEFTPHERVGARPTFEVHGIVGGYIGEGSKTVIPAEATAKITMRLVPNQDPVKIGEQFIQYVKDLAPDTVSVNVVKYDRGPAALIDRDDPAIVAATTAFERGFGQTPVFAREGGSIPVVAMVQQHLNNLPVAMMGFGLPDDNLHAPNEKINLSQFHGGVETSIHFLHEYARLKQS